MLVYSLFFSIYLSIFLYLFILSPRKYSYNPFPFYYVRKKFCLFSSASPEINSLTRTHRLYCNQKKKKTQTNNDFYNLLFRKHLKSVVKTQLPISPHLFLSLLFGNYCYSASAITRHTYNTLQTHKHNTNTTDPPDSQ